MGIKRADTGQLTLGAVASIANAVGDDAAAASVKSAAQLPALLPELWGAIARATFEAEGGTLRALVRLSRVGVAWRDGLRGESKCPVARGCSCDHGRTTGRTTSLLCCGLSDLFCFGCRSEWLRYVTMSCARTQRTCVYSAST